MGRQRQTLPVDILKNRVNRMLAAEGGTEDGRKALAVLIEGVLMDTGNYKGFGYLPAEWEKDGTGLRDGYDDTRRRYT